MASEFFLDTSYAIALSVESDEHHQLAEELAERLSSSRLLKNWTTIHEATLNNTKQTPSSCDFV